VAKNTSFSCAHEEDAEREGEKCSLSSKNWFSAAFKVDNSTKKRDEKEGRPSGKKGRKGGLPFSSYCLWLAWMVLAGAGAGAGAPFSHNMVGGGKGRYIEGGGEKKEPLRSSPSAPPHGQKRSRLFRHSDEVE